MHSGAGTSRDFTCPATWPGPSRSICSAVAPLILASQGVPTQSGLLDGRRCERLCKAEKMPLVCARCPHDDVSHCDPMIVSNYCMYIPSLIVWEVVNAVKKLAKDSVHLSSTLALS